MNWRERLQLIADSPGWRRHAPVGGTIVVHGVVIAGVAGMMATAKPIAEIRREPRQLIAIELLPDPNTIADVLPAGVTPPPRVRKSPAATDPRTATTPTRPAAGPPVATNEDKHKAAGDTVYLGPPSIFADPKAPPGLASLMGNDPCATRLGVKPKECAGRDLAARTGPMDSLMPRSQDQLAQHYAEFMPTCGLRSGCDGGEWISTNGTRSVGRPPPGSANDRGVGTPGAGGAASLGGLHTSVGRLGFNRDHTDPGFGD